MTTVRTPNSLRRSSRRLDRLNRNVATVLDAMRAGCTLHLEFFSTGSRWKLSNGLYVNNTIALVVINNKHVCGVGDALFASAPSQTWRYIEN
jgi:hypothetical protein